MRRNLNGEHHFEAFRRALIGLKVSQVWRGYGSALFLEFGALTPSSGRRRDGGERGSSGELTLMIEWSWRIEDIATIICGSWSEEHLWPPAFERLQGGEVVEARLFGRLPEISIGLSNG